MFGITISIQTKKSGKTGIMTTTNSLLINNSGTGDASGITFDGSAAKTISFNTVGAQQKLNGTGLVRANGTTITYDATNYLSGVQPDSNILSSANWNLAYNKYPVSGVVNGTSIDFLSRDGSPAFSVTGLSSGGGGGTSSINMTGQVTAPSTTTGTLVATIGNSVVTNAMLAGAISDTKISSAAYWSAKQAPITLTTNNDTAATFIGNVLNIPSNNGGGTNTGYTKAEVDTIAASKSNVINTAFLPLSSSNTVTWTHNYSYPNRYLELLNNGTTTITMNGTQEGDMGTLEIGRTTATASGTVVLNGYQRCGTLRANAGVDVVDWVNIQGNIYWFIRGSNATLGSGTSTDSWTATLVNGTVTVSNSLVTAGSNILLTYQNCNNCGTVYKGTIIAGTSFTINSTNVNDNSIVYWKIEH